MRWKWSLASGIAVLTYGLYSTGLSVYFRSIARPIQKSAFESADEDIILKVPQPRGTVLLLHGMNFEASKLIPLGEVLHKMGYKVFIPRLAGHRGNAEETKQDPTPIWKQQVENWHSEIQGPLICMGYSLGGLLVTSEHLNGRLKCDRFILFAPALAARTSLSTAKLIEKLWPTHWMIPSGIPDNYKHFTYLGLAPSFALVHILESFSNHLKNSSMADFPPGLVFIDPRDEVVDAEKVISISQQSFDDWQVREVNAIDLPETHAFHLIVDEIHLGKDQWDKVVRDIQRFLGRSMAAN